jgi:hypothetical protein|nr:MAG TPA: hypothetical protein [Crassvirales sp.]
MNKETIEKRFKMEKVKQDSKAARLKRMVRFKREILPSLDAYDVRACNHATMFKFFDERWGEIDVYPMADKLLVIEDHEWVRGARKWIIKNIFLEQ